MPATALPRFLSKKQNRYDDTNPRPSIRDLPISEPIPHPLADVPSFTQKPRKAGHVYTSSQESNQYSATSTVVTTPEPDIKTSFKTRRRRLPEAIRNKRLPLTPVDAPKRKPLPNWDVLHPDDSPLPAQIFPIKTRLPSRRYSTSSDSSGSVYPTPLESQENLAADQSASIYSDDQAHDCSYLHVGENIEPVEHFAVLRWSKLGLNEPREALFVEVYTHDGRMLIPVVYPPEYEAPLVADQAHATHPEDVYQVVRKVEVNTPPRIIPPETSTIPQANLNAYENEINTAWGKDVSTTLPPPSRVIGIVPGSLQQPPSPSSLKDGNWVVTQRNKFAVSPKNLKVWMTGSVVGSGAFGRVVRVLHVPSETEMAMKVLHIGKPLRKIACDGLMNELKVLTTLAIQSGKEAIPFLATPSLDCDKWAWLSAMTGFLHILTPFCPGGDLYSYGGNLSFESIRLIVAELILGLSYLHSLGIVHHDFKPENVVIDPQGHCVITDFGGSRFLNERGKLTRTTQEDIICSCPYAAPELFEERPGIMFYDERVDWFSLGVVIYTLLVGSELFSRNGQMAKGQRASIETQFHRKFPYKIEEQPALYDFMFQLLRFRPEHRLSGEKINHHVYLAPFKNHWNEIVNRQYKPPITHVRDIGGNARGYCKPPKDDWMTPTTDKPGFDFRQVLVGEGWYLPESDEYDFPSELKALARS